jgi:hypothetical protein
MAEIIGASGDPISVRVDKGICSFAGCANSKKAGRPGLKSKQTGGIYCPDMRWARGRVNAVVERAKCRRGILAIKSRLHVAKILLRRQ